MTALCNTEQEGCERWAFMSADFIYIMRVCMDACVAQVISFRIATSHLSRTMTVGGTVRIVMGMPSNDCLPYLILVENREWLI